MQQNRYEKFVKLLIKQTNDGVANWELIKPQSLPFVIEQSDWINRSFRCRDFESAKGSDIYLIGQVVPNFQNSGGVEFDRFNLYVYLFKDGKISSGMASSWLNIPRIKFLLKAFDAGAVLMEDNEDDFRRETAEI